MRFLLVTILVLLLTGCAGSLETAHMRGQLIPRAAGETRDTRRCQELDEEYRRWSGWEALGISIAAGTGGGQIPVEYLPPEYQAETRFGLAVATVSAAAFAAFASDRSDTANETWARECSGG